MNTPAIYQAMRLESHPKEMAWLCFSDTEFPQGITDLLRLCASKEQLVEYANTNNFDSVELSNGLHNFIEKAIVNENNSYEKILGGDQFTSLQVQKYHYQLLMKIYHPDLSDRDNAEHYTAIITKAYKKLKNKAQLNEAISFSESRKPPQSYYQATQKAETQISNAKTAIAVISALSIIALVSMAGKIYHPANTEFLTDNKDSLVNITDTTKLIKVAAIKSDINPNIEIEIKKSINDNLQSLLKDLETAYEQGSVDKIKPILVNAPEIKHQTDQQINEKLVTLFEITAERKMVLFDFNWQSITGVIEGKGKFLSRYKLVGEDKWITREGTALVSVKNDRNKLKISQLILENQSID